MLTRNLPLSIYQLSSAACLACECSAGTVQVGLFLLPLIGRLRLMVFCALFSLLITCLMLFLDISHIALMFPFNWTKVVGTKCYNAVVRILNVEIFSRRIRGCT